MPITPCNSVKSGGANGARLPGTARLTASGVGAPGPTGEHAELGRAGGDPPEPRRARGSLPWGPGQGTTRAFTWAPHRRAVASRVPPAASGPRRPLSPAARAADRAGRAAGAPEPPRRGGPPSRAAGSRHAFPPPGGRPRSRARRGKGLPRTAGPTDGRRTGGRAGARTGSATRAAPLPQRRRRPGPCCCCQLVGRTLSMRARGPHPGNFRVWPFSPPPPRRAPFSRLPPPPAQIREGPSAQAPAGSSGLLAAGRVSRAERRRWRRVAVSRGQFKEYASSAGQLRMCYGQGCRVGLGF
ncbi:translation initiation factor IF-2-like [Alexandromys fortis]|uniref:translation initiation factor IF-2-like n=1 Tax=Alexandromys fortis TaxID=100897 RepID=UPI0021534D6A|nr:translation initiation factor IF-2-like [Microtus fortis]